MQRITKWTVACFALSRTCVLLNNWVITWMSFCFTFTDVNCRQSMHVCVCAYRGGMRAALCCGLEIW